MRTHAVKQHVAAEHLVGTFADTTMYDVLLRETVRVLKPDGSLLLVLLKRGISAHAGAAMYHAIQSRISKTDNRGAASGQERIRRVLKSTGKLSRSNRTDQSVHSSIMGFYDRYPRFPYCRKSAFLDHHPQAYHACLPAIVQANNLFAQHAPTRYAAQKSVADKTHPDFKLPGTVFTTLTLNKNFRTACHKDAGDLPDGFGVMTYFRAGKFNGGHLVFPAYRVAVFLDTYDCLLFDPHEVHGNTEIEAIGTATPYHRITCVHYYRQGMKYCGSAAEELALAQAHDPRQGSRRLKAPARAHLEVAPTYNTKSKKL